MSTDRDNVLAFSASTDTGNAGSPATASALAEDLHRLEGRLQTRVAPFLGRAREKSADSAFRIHRHIADPLESSGGASVSIRLTGGHTPAGSEVGTDVLVISHPTPSRFEVRRLSSTKAVTEQLAWPPEGTPSDQNLDALLGLLTEEFLRGEMVV